MLVPHVQLPLGTPCIASRARSHARSHVTLAVTGVGGKRLPVKRLCAADRAQGAMVPRRTVAAAAAVGALPWGTTARSTRRRAAKPFSSWVHVSHVAVWVAVVCVLGRGGRGGVQAAADSDPRVLAGQLSVKEAGEVFLKGRYIEVGMHTWRRSARKTHPPRPGSMAILYGGEAQLAWGYWVHSRLPEGRV